MTYPILGAIEVTEPGAPGHQVTVRIGEAKYENPRETLLIGFAGEQGSGKTWWRRRVEKELDTRQMPHRLLSEMPDEDVIQVQTKGMSAAAIGLDIIVPIVKEISDARRPKLPEQIEHIHIDMLGLSDELCAALHANGRLLAEHIAATLAKIGREMVRQIVIEGFGPAHDDQYGKGELENAACCYAHAASFVGARREILHMDPPPSVWPWPAEWWKPKTPERDAVRAAALLGAALMSRDREEAAKEAEALRAPTRQQAEG